MRHPVETLWREVGLPEYFLGNDGSNNKLYALYDAIFERCAKIADQVAVNAERRAACHAPQSAAQEAAYNKMEGAQQTAQSIRERADPMSPADRGSQAEKEKSNGNL